MWSYRKLRAPKPEWQKETRTANKKATPRNRKAPAGKRGKKVPRPKPSPKAVSREAEPESASEPEPEPVPKPAPTLRRRAKPRVPPVALPVSKASESKQEEPPFAEAPVAAAPRGYTLVSRVLEVAGAPQLLQLFKEHEIDDSALPTIEPRDLIELGVAPMMVLAILGPSSAASKSKKLADDDFLHGVAKHQLVLEAELAEHRAEIEKLRIGRGELPDDYYCSITCEVMSDPVMAADGYSYERVAIAQWFATGARTSPKTNELLENQKLLPNKALKALIADELERRARV